MQELEAAWWMQAGEFGMQELEEASRQVHARVDFPEPGLRAPGAPGPASAPRTPTLTASSRALAV